MKTNAADKFVILSTGHSTTGLDVIVKLPVQLRICGKECT